MTPRRHDDESLMARVKAGDGARLEPLVRRYASPLLTFIRRMVGDLHRSEELFQEVFLAVWLKRRQYQPPRPFKPWLYAIALNKVRATMRRRQPVAVAALVVEGEGISADPSPERVAISTETAHLVARAVDRLPPKQRQVVVLRVWNGMSYAEIAEILDTREATVRSHMHHGLAALRDHLNRIARDD